MSRDSKSFFLYRDPSVHEAVKSSQLQRYVRTFLACLHDPGLIEFHPNYKHTRPAHAADYSHVIILRPILEWVSHEDYRMTAGTLVAVIINSGWEVLAPDSVMPADRVSFYARPVSFPLREIPLNVTVTHWRIRQCTR